MITIELQLEHIIAMKSKGGSSMRNLIERPMLSVNFHCQGLACSHEESSVEGEEGICKVKSA